MDQAFPQPVLFRVEKEIAELLLEKLEHSEIDHEKASKIARFVLNLLPEGIADEQIDALILKLDDEFYELVEIVNQYISEYEKTHKPLVLEEVSKLTKSGNLEEASKLMQDYFIKITNKKVASQPI